MRKLKAEYIVKIVDLMPKDIEDLKFMFLHSDIPFKDEDFQQIIEIVKKYGKK